MNNSISCAKCKFLRISDDGVSFHCALDDDQVSLQRVCDMFSMSIYYMNDMEEW